MIVEPVPAVIPAPPPPVVTFDSPSAWAHILAVLRGQKPTGEVLVARTLPALTMDDLTPYHWVQEDGKMRLRKGAPPAVIKSAAADFANGHGTLNDFLDSIGVPK